ncbi:MAG: succinate dehydrogenase cytochrome b subunit [Fimbriiglobus sp.]
MSQAIHPKGARVTKPGMSALDWATDYLNSTVGQKMLVAVTGLSLVTFVLFHMIGNLKMFSGRESINDYAYFLKHGMGALIWVARAGLLGTFALHLFITIRLKLKSKAARTVGYYMQKSAQATPQSKVMLSTGLVIAAFTVFHLAHYTFAWIHPVTLESGLTVSYLDLQHKGKHDVYNMVIAGFQTPWLSAIYIVSQLILFIHLSHGIQSSLQTLGLTGKRFFPVARMAGYGLAATILAGNLAIVIAIWAGFLKAEL